MDEAEPPTRKSNLLAGGNKGLGGQDRPNIAEALEKKGLDRKLRDGKAAEGKMSIGGSVGTDGDRLCLPALRRPVGAYAQARGFRHS